MGQSTAQTWSELPVCQSLPSACQRAAHLIFISPKTVLTGSNHWDQSKWSSLNDRLDPKTWISPQKSKGLEVTTWQRFIPLEKLYILQLGHLSQKSWITPKTIKYIKLLKLDCFLKKYMSLETEHKRTEEEKLVLPPSDHFTYLYNPLQQETLLTHCYYKL